jgi:hypothetical protein
MTQDIENFILLFISVTKINRIVCFELKKWQVKF